MCTAAAAAAKGSVFFVYACDAATEAAMDKYYDFYVRTRILWIFESIDMHDAIAPRLCRI